MNSELNKKITVIILSIFLLTSNSFAKQVIESKITNMDLISIAGNQRMLSQRIAKDYLYAGKNIAYSKANRQLKKSLDDFLSTHKKLRASISDPDIKNLLTFVELSSNDFKTLINEDFSIDNAQLILDLSESMLEGSQYIFDSLQSTLKIKESELIGKSTVQRMLSQRIAKYYISYQSGIKDKNSVDMMKNTVKQFSENLKSLMKNSTNTPQVNKELKEIDKLWRIVHKFYNNIEKGGLPLIVFNSTDNISKKMDKVTQMYVAIHK